MENPGTGYGLTPSSFDLANADDREELSRSAALRARIAALVAGPDPEIEPELTSAAPPVDVTGAAADAVRALLPGLVRDSVHEAVNAAVRESIQTSVRDVVREEVRAVVAHALPDLLGPALTTALHQQRDDVLGMIGEHLLELRASVVANATMPSFRPDRLAADMAALRADVGRGLDTIHQRVAERIAERFSAMRAELRSDISAEVMSGHAAVVDRIRRGLIGEVSEALLSIQREFTQTAEAHRVGIAALSQDVRTLVADQIELLRHAAGEIGFLGDNLRSTLTAYADEQLAVLEAAADRSGAGVADLSDNVQRQIAEFSSRISHELQDVVLAGRESLGSIGPSVRGDVSAVTGAVRVEVEALTGGVREDLAELANRLRRDVAGLAASVRSDVDGAATRTKAELDRLVADVRTTLAQELATTIDTAREGAVVGVAAAVERGVGELQSVVAATQQELAASRSEVALFSDRFAKAGEALLDHLAARDLLLEQARDEMFGQLLAELTAGMNERDRTAAGKRLMEITKRRRDERDAERWRAGRPAAGPLPPDIKNENELLALLDTHRAAGAGDAPGDPRSDARGDAEGVTSAPFVAPDETVENRPEHGEGWSGA